MLTKPSRTGLAEGCPWRVWFCVLLAALILYNPFIALHCTHTSSGVHTPQRNRATVGASELDHFSPVKDDYQQSHVNLEENREEVTVPAGSYVARGFEREYDVPQPDSDLRVWSRPPPTL